MSPTFGSFFIKSFYISFSPIVFNSIHRLRKVKNLFDSTAHKRWKIQSAIKIFLQIRVFIYTFYFRKFSKFLKINLVFFFYNWDDSEILLKKMKFPIVQLLIGYNNRRSLTFHVLKLLWIYSLSTILPSNFQIFQRVILAKSSYS